MLRITKTKALTVTGLSKFNSVVNFKEIHRSNLPYIFIWILYYAWVVSFTTWWTASPVTDMVFNTGLRSLIHSINLLSSALFIFLIKKEAFVRMSRAGAILIITGMSSFLLIANPEFKLVSVIIIGITLGIVNISILIPFIFTLNNTEKFYAVIFSNMIINIIMLIQKSFIGSRQVGGREQLITFLLLIIPLVATLFFKKSSITSYEDDIVLPKMKHRIYLTLVYNCALAVLCKGAGKGVLDITAEIQGNYVYTWYFIGGFIGCLIYIVVFAFIRKAFTWISYITFSSITIGLMFSAFSNEFPAMAAMYAILLGIGSTIGMISMYYILGVVAKKYGSMRYIRLSILLIGICGGVSGVVVGNLIYRINAIRVSIAASLIAAAFMLIFLILSPLLSQPKYFNDWAKDSCMAEINISDAGPFIQYRLSKREIDICKLLLEGYTLRQISSILAIAYSTVNTYCTSLYRKLNINSRTELIMMFKDHVEELK